MTTLVLANAVLVGPQNKIGHPAHIHKQFKQVPVVSNVRGCTSGGVYVPCIYKHARCELL